MKVFLINILLIFSLQAKHAYNCSGIENFAASISYVVLKNTNNIDVDNLIYDKTKVVLISSEKIGDDLYKDVHHITFFLKNDEKVEVITINDSSSEECSMAGGDVYLIKSKISD